MTLQCRCDHCAMDIEFAAEQAGREINCPACGLATVLRDTRPPPTEKHQKLSSYARIRPIVVSVFVIGLTILVSYFFTLLLEASVLNGGEVVSVFFGIAIFLASLWLVAVWVMFPVIVYLGLKRMNRTLLLIERNTRPPQK